MAGAKVPLTFRIFKGDQLVREEKLSLSVIKLGKVPSAHLKLDDETVSRMHAIIEVNGPGDVSIIDLGSTKGTFVNGQKVNKAKLQSGDTIVVGETRIELAIGTTGEEKDEPTKVAAPAHQDIIASTPRPAVPMAPPPMAPPPRPAPMAPPPGAPPMAMAQTMAPPAPAPAVRPPPGMSGGGPIGGPAIFGAQPAPMAGFQQAMAGEADDFSGARAVEVAAMLGDSVVGVKHCIDPKGGKVTGATWGLFALGAACLCVFVFTFYTAVQNAAYNKGRNDYETQVLKKPGYSVRPRMLSGGFDWAAFGGLLASVGMMTTALVRMRKEKESPWARIGTAHGVEFAVAGAPSPAFPLVAPHGDDFAFAFSPGMEGEMVVNGQSTTLGERAAQGRTTISPIPSGAKIRVRVGRTTFLVSSVARPRRHAAPLHTIDPPFMVSHDGPTAAFG